MKVCVKCKQSKSLEEFYKRADRPNSYRSQCKVCHKLQSTGNISKNWNYFYDQKTARNYGLSVDEYHSLLIKANNCCTICGKGNSKKRLSVDHDHSTGKVRGMLCDKCNRGLGHFNDDPKLLQKAVKYLMVGVV